mgnify:CR=1 FL=1
MKKNNYNETSINEKTFSKSLNDHTNSKNTEKNEEKKKDRKWLWIILIIILLFIAFRLGSCYCNGPDCNPTISVGIGGNDIPTLDPNAGEYIEPEHPTASPSGVAIPGWGTITIPANQKDNIPIDLYNPEANNDRYYLTFEIRLPNTNGSGYEVLYKSGLIEAGLHIQNISLSRELDKGEYDVIIHVQPYRVSDKAATNNADMKTKLIVK